MRPWAHTRKGGRVTTITWLSDPRALAMLEAGVRIRPIGWTVEELNKEVGKS